MKVKDTSLREIILDKIYHSFWYSENQGNIEPRIEYRTGKELFELYEAIIKLEGIS